jgi:chaperonin GroES
MVLVQPEPLEERTAGGILIPRNAKAKHMIAKVLAVGPGKMTVHGVRIAPEVSAGNRVLIREFNMAQKVARVGGDDGPMLVPEMDIDAVLEEVPPALEHPNDRMRLEQQQMNPFYGARG